MWMAASSVDPTSMKPVLLDVESRVPLTPKTMFDSGVKLFAAYPRTLLVAHLALVIASAVFSLPLVTLNDPDAGLRLREDPVADMADGFLASLREAKPFSFPRQLPFFPIPPPTTTTASPTHEPTVSTRPTRSPSTHVPTVTRPPRPSSRMIINRQPLILVWYTDPLQNVVTETYLKEIRDFETGLFQLPTFQSEICLRSWTPPYACASYLSVANQEVNTNSTFLEKIARIHSVFPTLFSAETTPTNNFSSTAIRSYLYFGLPLPGFHTTNLEEGDQENVLYEKLKKELVPYITNRPTSSTLRLAYDQTTLTKYQTAEILVHDLTLAFASVFCIFLCVWIHTKSLFLSVGAIIQIASSFPMALYVYRVCMGVKLFGGFHVLAVFVILAIGINGCFVYIDVFKQHACCIYKAFPSAAYSLATTTLTTSVSFLALSTCGIPAVKYTGIFCSLLIGLNYVLIMTLYTCVLVNWDRYIRRIHMFKFPFKKPQLGKSLQLAEYVIKARLAILLTYVVMVSTLAYYAAQLQVSKTIDTIFPVGHPFQVYDELTYSGFFYGDDIPKINVNFVFGLKAPYRHGYDIANNFDFGTPIYDESFDLGDARVQEAITKQCDNVRSQLSVDGELHSHNAWSFCPVNEFREYVKSQNLPFPIPDRTNSLFLLGLYIAQQANGSSPSWQLSEWTKLQRQIDNLPRMVFNSFRTTRTVLGQSFDARTRFWRAWSRFSLTANSSVPRLGVNPANAPVDGFSDVLTRTQAILLDSAKTTATFSLLVVFIILFFATRFDVAVAAAGTACVISTTCSTLGLMYLFGWSLGILESIATTVIAAIAEDPIVIVCVEFTKQPKGSGTRRDRTIAALNNVGASVAFGGFTMFAASCVLLFTTLAVLTKFGQFMIIVIILSLLHALCVLPAMLSIPLPVVNTKVNVCKGCTCERLWVLLYGTCLIVLFVLMIYFGTQVR